MPSQVNEAKAKAIAETKARIKAAVEGRDAAEIAVEPVVEGYDETEPGQEEIVAGTPEHMQEVTAFPNATSYSPDVNVVIPPEPPPTEPPATAAPTNVDVPFVSATGNLLNCTMGNWIGEPTSYKYQWMRDGSTAIGTDSADYTTVAADAGTTLTCVVTATNAIGSTTAPPSNGVDIAATTRSGRS